MNERKVIIIRRHKRGEKIEQNEIRKWQFASNLFGFVDREHRIKAGDLLWYNDHSRFHTPEKVIYLYPVEVIQVGKGNQKVKVRFTDENDNTIEKWIWTSSLRSEVLYDR